MTNTTEHFCNEQLLLPKFGTNLLTPPIFISYSFAISKQYFANIFREISRFSGTNG